MFRNSHNLLFKITTNLVAKLYNTIKIYEKTSFITERGLYKVSIYIYLLFLINSSTSSINTDKGTEPLRKMTS